MALFSTGLWADDVTLADIDFTSAAWTGKTFSQGNTTNYDLHNGIYFYSKNSDAAKQFSLSNNTTDGLTFPNNNMSSGNYYFCIPLSNINGEITVTWYHEYSSSKAKFNYVFVDGRETYVNANTNGSSGTGVSDSNNSDTQTSFTINATSDNHKGHLIIGRGGSGFTKIRRIVVTTPNAATYTVTYKSGDGTGDDVVDDDAKTVKTFATCGFTAPDGYEFKEWQDAGSNVVAEGATVSADMTLTAIYRLIPTKYTVTYSLNGASGDAPTETNKAENDVFTLAAAPTWAGYRFDGWLCSADGLVKAAGASYTMTAANTTFTAQWTEVDCKIYSFTGGIGAQTVQAAAATIDAGSMVITDSKGIIKLTPAAGETFKAGDVITISGIIGNTAKNYGVKISNAADAKSTLGTASVAGTTVPLVATTTLSADADYLYLCRADGTTTTLLTCEVHRSCAEGTAAGLAYTTAAVEKTMGDAAFTNALTNANSLVVSYGSSAPAVATVNANGQVTLVSAGSATITAYSAVQTKAGTLYAAGSASYTLTVNPAPTYTVTYNLNGGTGTTPTQAAQEAGAVFALHDGTTGITAPENKTFVKWKDQDDNLFNGGADYTMPAKNVTLTAQWAGDTYTVIYKDGETELDRETVEVGSHPIGIAEPTKQYYEFAAWQLSGSDIELDEVTGTKDAEVILIARWAVLYANSVDFTESIANLATYLSENNYFLASTSGVTLDNSNAYDTGLKMKSNEGNTLRFTVAANKRFTLTVGNISGMTIKINEGAAEAIVSGTDKDHLGVSYHESVNEQIVIITETSTAYNIIRSIIITDYGVVPTALDNTADEAKAVKFIENGMLIIEKNGVRYNAQGQVIK